jgi:hypothetical protein
MRGPNHVVRLIRDHAERIEIIETPVQGKKALDFILAYEIGRQAVQDPEGYFHIIAKDGGYDALLLQTSSGRCAGRSLPRRFAWAKASDDGMQRSREGRNISEEG